MQGTIQIHRQVRSMLRNIFNVEAAKRAVSIASSKKGKSDSLMSETPPHAVIEPTERPARHRRKGSFKGMSLCLAMKGKTYPLHPERRNEPLAARHCIRYPEA